MLVPGSVPPDLTRLGYGNPFNSMLVCSFFRNFVQTKNDRSRLFVEERFTEAMTMSLLPDSLHSSPAKGEKLLLELMDEFPADTIWQTPAPFERVARSEERRVGHECVSTGRYRW